MNETLSAGGLTALADMERPDELRLTPQPGYRIEARADGAAIVVTARRLPDTSTIVSQPEPMVASLEPKRKGELEPYELIARCPGLTRDTIHRWRMAGYITARRARKGKLRIYLYAEDQVPCVRRMMELTEVGYAPHSAYQIVKEEKR